MKYIPVMVLLFSLLNFAQEKQQLTGNLYSDSRIVMKDYRTSQVPTVFYTDDSKKSLFLAGALSAIVPGAGEIYSGQYIKGAIFLLVDAAAIYTAVDYNKKGDDQTNYFQNYADQNWSVVKYAEWLNANFGKNIEINPDQSLKPWQRVNWSQLNDAEVGSHKLPPYGEQQYYELIGKYHQFAAGWDDFGGGTDPAPTPSPNFESYSRMRGHANDLYNVSTKAVIVIFVNHILSAIDAVWSASNYNKDLKLGLAIQENNFIYNKELAPVFSVSYNF